MPKRQGLRVLVVGDQREFAEPLALPFQADGHVVKTVPDGPSALEAAQEDLPDVVFLGLPLRSLDGATVVKRMQELSTWKRPMFVAITKPSEQDVWQGSPEAGIDLLLIAPVDPAKLQGFLRRFQTVVQDLGGFDPMI